MTIRLICVIVFAHDGELQPVLVNLINRSVFNTKVSRGSVATHLRCGEICNGQFITKKSLLNLLVKKY